jgi:hypothetical protein
MIATKNVLSWMLVATVFAGTATACGSDAKKATTTAAPAAAPAAAAAGDTAAPAAAGGDAGGAISPEAAAFCKSIDELTVDLKKVMADPANGDIAGLMAKANELSTKAAALMTASAADSAAIQACTDKMSAALTPGG